MKSKSNKSMSGKAAAEEAVKNIRRATRKVYGAEEKIRIALAITCSVQFGLHSLVDFSLQMPAISYLWCAIVAASVALAHRCELVEKANTRV